MLYENFENSPHYRDYGVAILRDKAQVKRALSEIDWVKVSFLGTNFKPKFAHLTHLKCYNRACITIRGFLMDKSLANAVFDEIEAELNAT